MHNPLEILHQYWGYPAFRELQGEIIDSVLEGKHTLALMPTGGGKSICFQVPALCLEGLCIVVSPLIALMKDQVHQLKERGVKAEAIYSGMSKREVDVTLDNCIYGDVKFLYVSPERLKTEIFLERAYKMNIALLAIDEAHCISQWGYDFRPPYLEIADFIELFQVQKLIALTASATLQVKDDIIERLGMKDPMVFRKSFARANLSYSVFHLENKGQKVLEILNAVPGSAVIYVRNRKKTKLLADFLAQNGISSNYYHAGLSADIRSSRQDDWIGNKTRVIVSTNAFGMGIDKPDVRSVIHYDLPDSLEAYYQEAGRAGRDEKKAYAIALYHRSDVDALLQRTTRAAVDVPFIRRVYQALANHHKLAVGSQANASFSFEYEQFISNFSLPPVETYYALNKLSEQGLVQVNDNFYPVSRVIFNLTKEEVYEFQVSHGNVDPIIKALMRLHGGELFSNYVTVKESDIGRLLKVSKSNVQKQLLYLHQSGFLEYQQASSAPMLTFLTPRFNAEDLPLDTEMINWRKEVAIGKANAVRDYLAEGSKCRTAIIQAYFGEHPGSDCGVCDNCLKKKKGSGQVPLDQVLSLITADGVGLVHLKKMLKSYSEDKIQLAIRQLLDFDRIRLDNDKFYRVE